jgi:hypothetical protein
VDEAAAVSGVIGRRRKFTASSLARTFVLGFLGNPDASDEELAWMAVQCGADVSPQAIDQRHTPKLVKFLEELFRRATEVVVGSARSLAPLLDRFTAVTLLDSTTITLPDDAAGTWPGCGGGLGGGAAAVKLQTEWDLRSGAVTHVQAEPGRSADGATTRQQARRDRGSLRVSDLGYFNLAVFADLAQAGAYFLSRLQPGTHAFLPGGTSLGWLGVLGWLARQVAGFIDQEVELGQEQRLPCRLIAWRVPQEQADRRRQKLRREMRSRDGREPSAERLAWCDWTVLVTNAPAARLCPPEAAVLYRARWQVELLFKRWKAQDRVAVLRGATAARQLVGVWARLLAALVQHWLVVGATWGDATKSLSKACEAVRAFAGRLAAGLDGNTDLRRVLADLAAVLAKTCRRNKRSQPGTFELLNDVSLLDYQLT